jgi:predicted nucleic acid-binding Zn ribbon protein
MSRRHDPQGRRRPRPSEINAGELSRREPYSIERILDAYLAAEGLEGLRLLDAVDGLWPQLVGEAAARHSRPRALNGAELVVAVDNPARVTELVFLAPSICDRLAELLGRRVVERVKGQVDGHFRLD